MNHAFEKMSEAELRALAADASTRADWLARRIPREQMLKMLDQYLDQHGWGFDELMGLPGTPPGRQKVPLNPPRYRDPATPSRTWSGRGRKPHWLLEKQNEGLSLDDLRIYGHQPSSGTAKAEN